MALKPSDGQEAAPLPPAPGHQPDLVAQKVSEYVRQMLEALGEDPARPGLRKTPARVAKSYQFLLQGYASLPAAIIKSAIYEGAFSEMVLVRGIETFSLCEHHLLPFFGKTHVAYIPNGKIVGLSKIPRVVDAFARRLQVQERLTVQIRDAIQETLNPRGVAVVMEATHLCMVMRGVQKQHSITTTSAMSGIFLSNSSTRGECLRLMRGD